jgi:NADH:ubiquinone oxidoreductase subunit H
VEFIAQHAILVVSLVKIAALSFDRTTALVVVSLVKILVLLIVAMTALAYLTWFERKVVAHIQSRWGPYTVFYSPSPTA